MKLPWIKLFIGILASISVVTAAAYTFRMPDRSLNPNIYPQSWTRYGMDAQSNANYVTTVEKQSWTSQLAGSAHGGVSIVKGYVYVGNDGNQVSALNAKTGAKVWTTTLNNQVMTQPLVVNNSVFVGTGNNQFQANGIRGTGNNEIASLNSKTGQIQWTIPTRAEDMPSLVYNNGLLYDVNGAGTLRAINPVSGQVEWQMSLGGIDSMSSPVIYNGVLYVGLSKPYEVVAVNVRTHQVVFRTPIQNAQLALDDSSIAYGHGLIYAQSATFHGSVNQETVWGINATTGTVSWHFTEPSGVKLTPEEYNAAAPVYAGGVVYFGTPFGKQFYALDAKTGHLKWQTTLHTAANQAPVVVNNDVVIGDSGGTLYVINKQTGHILNTSQLSNYEIFGNGDPVVVNDVFYSATAIPNQAAYVTAISLMRLDPNINKP